jgi:hypothetical protein
MKKLIFSFLLLLASVTVSFSQDFQFQSGREKHDGKPQMFQSIAQKFAVKSNFIEEVMSVTEKQTVSLSLTEGLSFKGSVLAKQNDQQGLTTVVIQSAEVSDLFLTISKVVMPDQPVLYRAIIMSKSYSDVLVLEKDPVTGTYNWNKIMLSRLLPD